MSIDVHPAPPSLDPTALATLDAGEFYRHVGDINTAFSAATDAYQTAQENLTVLLTEQVSRHIINIHPTAALVFVRAAAEYHHAEDNTRATTCDGHNHRLVPFEVLDEDGVVLGGFDPYSPVMYLMERLSPFLGIEDQVLDIAARDWALDCIDD